MGDRPQTEVVVPILLFSLFYVKSFLSHYHSFSLVLKLRERVHFLMLYNLRHAVAVNVELVLGQSRVEILWPCSFIETSDRVEWDLSIAKWSFIFLKVSS